MEEENGQENEEKRKNDNVVFVGSKPLVNYVRAVLMQFNKHGASEVIIKSRGKFISKAVDITEIVKRTLQDRKVYAKSINLASESFEVDGRRTNVSTMDVVLSF